MKSYIKNLTLLCLVAVSFACTAQPGLEIYERDNPNEYSLRASMLLWAGQSNAESLADTSTLDAALRGDLTDIYIFDPFTDAFVPYHAGVTSNPVFSGFILNRFGGELKAAVSLRDSLGDPVYIVKYGISGTGLGLDGVALDFNVASTGEIHDEFVRRVTLGIQQLKDADTYPKIAGMGWQHGEEDSQGDGTKANAYYDNLFAFVQSIRRAAKQNFEFVLTRVDSSSGQASVVRAAMTQLSGEDVHMHLVDIDDLSSYKTDGTHYGADGQLIIGQRMFELLERSK